MSTDYSKLKNAELESLLKERSLPHTGKKAEMVARLVEDDAKQENSTAKDGATINKEDEIDWSDDGEETAAPTEAATVEGGQGKVADAPAVTDQVVAEKPATTNDASTSATTTKSAEAGTADSESAQKEEKPAVDFSVGLASATMDLELEKRKKRAERFGTVSAATAAEDGKSDALTEAEKLAKRAAKFGTGTEAPRGLNEALPEKPLKRRREGGDETTRGDFKRRGQGGRARGGRKGGEAPTGGNSKPARRGDWMTEKDRAAADARKAKWATPANS